MHIAVNNRNVILFFFQLVTQTISYHHGTMPPTGASDADRQVRLPLAFIKRQQILQHIGESFDRLAHLGMLIEKRADLWMIAGKVFQLRLEVRVRKMANVEQKIEVARISKLMTEADDQDF